LTSTSEEEVKEFCCGKMAAYKIPKHVLLVGAIPRTDVGKVEKGSLKEEVIKQL